MFAMVYIIGSAALKVRSALLQHVVFTMVKGSRAPVGQHQEFAERQ
jgi:hypothetical protein